MLKYNDWIKLDKAGRAHKFKELSEHDKFYVRMGNNGEDPSDGVLVNDKSGLTQKQIDSFTTWRKQLLNDGKITQQQFDDLEKWNGKPV